MFGNLRLNKLLNLNKLKKWELSAHRGCKIQKIALSIQNDIRLYHILQTLFIVHTHTTDI